MNGVAFRSSLKPSLLRASSSRLCWSPLCFSTSSRTQRHGALPKLPESFSSPELTRLAHEIRNRFMLPNHLTEEQRRMIYRSSLHYLLTTGDGYQVDLDGEIIVLQPATTMQQPGMGLIKPVVKLIKTKEDVEALIPSLLAEIKLSGRYAGSDFLQRLVRKAFSTGAADLVIRLADDVNNSGLRLGTRDVLREVLWGIEDVPLGLPAPELLDGVTTALRRAQRMLTHLDDPRHEVLATNSGYPGSAAKLFKLSQVPESTGVLVELAAMQAVLLEHGSLERKDALKVLEHYLRALRASWPDFQGRKAGAADRKVAMVVLRDWAPVVHGLRLVREFRTIDGGLYQWTGQALSELDPIIQSAKDTIVQLNAVGESRGLRKLAAYEAFAEKRKSLGQGSSADENL